jgi:hypothetical protein
LIQVQEEGREDKVLVRLELGGYIDRSLALVAAPGILDFGDMTRGATSRRKVTIRGDRSVLKLLPPSIAVNSDGAATHVALRVDQVASAIGRKEFDLTFSPGDSLQGSVETSVVIEVAGQNPRRLVIPVRARIAEPIVAFPRRILLAVNAGEVPPETQVVVRSVDGRAITPKRVWCDLPLRVRPMQGEANDQLMIQVTPEGKVASGTQRGNVFVQTNEVDTQLAVPIVLVGSTGETRVSP